MYGKRNLIVGFATLLGFMIYGFVLIYLRDFAPGRVEWIASYNDGKHFEARLAHVHGNLFAMLNIVIGLLLLKLEIIAPGGQGGLLAGFGWDAHANRNFMEVYLGTSPIIVMAGGVAMVLAVGCSLVLVISSYKKSGL